MMLELNSATLDMIWLFLFSISILSLIVSELRVYLFGGYQVVASEKLVYLYSFLYSLLFIKQ